MLLTEHLAVTIPPGRKLPSSWEQGSSTCDFEGEFENMKAAGQADKKGKRYIYLLTHMHQQLATVHTSTIAFEL